eukprot:1757835-Pyramimonas_sp.AAC.1
MGDLLGTPQNAAPVDPFAPPQWGAVSTPATNPFQSLHAQSPQVTSLRYFNILLYMLRKRLFVRVSGVSSAPLPLLAQDDP